MNLFDNSAQAQIRNGFMTPNVNISNQISTGGQTEEFNKNRAALFAMSGLNMNVG
jgi:hypothetical protein